MSGTIRTFAERLVELAVPPMCPGCRTEGQLLCPDCRNALAGRRGEPGFEIGLPSAAPLPLAQLEWCARYRDRVRRVLLELKYGGASRVALPLGQLIAARWSEVGVGATVVVPVPVHELRRRTRGYDQAALIATSAAATLGLRFLPALVRIRATTPQFDLDRDRRSTNLRDAFRVDPAARGALACQWVLLVDDVTTTGATLVAAAEALIDGGALAVSGLTVAREA